MTTTTTKTEMTDLSEKLKNDSKDYYKGTKNLNLQMLYRKYGPPTIVMAIVFFVLYIRFYWF